LSDDGHRFDIRNSAASKNWSREFEEDGNRAGVLVSNAAIRAATAERVNEFETPNLEV
jgi:hypothetical protein